ncbi:MAG TPA: hypothetical protein VG347_21500 [Verrucomicrobiae bacterium]|nr:hypothetical protein [Verrucomicrobiae bacterium]
MGIWEWISQIVAVVSGIGGLWAAVFALLDNNKARREETKARKVANLLSITSNHRELWKECLIYPTLDRVIDPAADMEKQPVTPAEEFFMSMAISHTSSTYEALKDELLTKQEGLRRDVELFFSLPIPNAVWQRTKLLQNQDFAAFIESCLK